MAVAREYGFASWAKLKTEVDRREILDTRDVTRLNALLAEHPELAVEPMLHWCDHPQGATPLGYVAMLRYDTSRGIWRDAPDTGAIARKLLEAGAPPDGAPGDAETPLMVRRQLRRGRGRTGAGRGGRRPGRHRVARCGWGSRRHRIAARGGFRVADVVKVLLAAGGTDLVQAAAAGNITALAQRRDAAAGAGRCAADGRRARSAGCHRSAAGRRDTRRLPATSPPWLSAETPQRERVAALRMAAEHGRLDVIDQLLGAETPVDGVDADGSTALHEAAYSGRADSVRHLLARGADPGRRDSRFDGTPLGWCRHRRDETGQGHGHDEVEQILAPITSNER